jgi:hypothetical protein
VEVINLGAVEGLPPIDWTAIIDKLDTKSRPSADAPNAHSTWLTTVNADGSPHVTPVGALWMDGTFFFQTGAGTKKARNIERDPRCSVAVSVLDADVVLEGSAARVTSTELIVRLAQAWVDQGWPVEPDESGVGLTAPFNAPTQGPPPWNVYRVAPRSAVVILGAEPGGLTRFQF